MQCPALMAVDANASTWLRPALRSWTGGGGGGGSALALRGYNAGEVVEVGDEILVLNAHTQMSLSHKCL
jgi:hypothetical protein